MPFFRVSDPATGCYKWLSAELNILVVRRVLLDFRCPFAGTSLIALSLMCHLPWLQSLSTTTFPVSIPFQFPRAMKYLQQAFAKLFILRFLFVQVSMWMSRRPQCSWMHAPSQTYCSEESKSGMTRLSPSKTLPPLSKHSSWILNPTPSPAKREYTYASRVLPIITEKSDRIQWECGHRIQKPAAAVSASFSLFQPLPSSLLDLARFVTGND